LSYASSQRFTCQSKKTLPSGSAKLTICFSFFLFGGTGFGTQGLTLARQALCNLSHILSTFFFFGGTGI
jgi:hypothetical protein